MKRNVLWMLFITLPLWFFLISCGDGGSENDDNTGDTDDDGIVSDNGKTDTDGGLPTKDDGVLKDDAPLPDTDTPLPDTGDTDETQPDVDNGLDSDGDGIPDSKEGTGDTDGDGTPDYLDTDTDGDGIPDSVEAPGGITVDTDGDTTPDYKDTDSDGDGISDAKECPEQPCGDADSDGTKNYRDTDSDNDGIFDDKESGADPANPVDTDTDGTPDFLDTESDNDGIPDILEGPGDVDGDGIKNYLDDDCDGDDIFDSIEAGADPANPADTDGDTFPDFKDPDSDNDGLSDTKERELTTDPLKADTDGDGVSDMAEVAYGSNPKDKTSTIPAEDFYVVLPYQDPAQNDDLQFTTDVGIADVIIMIDLSASMSEEIENLKTHMGSVITNIVAEIPDTHFGLVAFSTWEAPTPYLLAQRVTDVSNDVQTALNALATTSIGWYEPQEETLYQVATGAGLTAQVKRVLTTGSPLEATYYDIAIPAITDCANGTHGGVCFRDDALPIFLMVTDEPFQGYDLPAILNDSGYSKIDGSWSIGTGHSLAQAITAMNAKNAKFIGIDSSADIATGPNTYYEQVATGTGSENTAGDPFIYKINSDGTVPSGGDLSAQIVSAVTELTNTVALALTTGKESVTNTYSIDTTQFIKAIDFSVADPAGGAQMVGGKLMVDPGTKVTYDVTFRNDFHDNKDPEARLFKAKILVIGAGLTLDTRDVFIIVPGTIPDPQEEE